VELLTRMDQVALAPYCETFARWKDANDRVVKHGSVVKSPSGYPIQSPYLSISNKAHGQMVRLLLEFGMTAAARAKVDVKKPQAKDNPLSKFIR
jgi:P27 family predicted phage terminase small subunit